MLHVPAGGTRAIDEDAKAALAFNVPAGKLGPNGGNISVIGGSPVELVADKDSQEVRLYLLNNEYAAVDPGEREFRLGWASASPGMEVLVREPGADYYVGRWYAGFDPFRVTVGMTLGGVTHVGIVGWSYGTSLRFGVGAPMVGFVGARGWAPSVAVGVGVGFGMGMSARWGRSVAVGGGVRVGGGVGVGGGVHVAAGGGVGGRVGGGGAVHGGAVGGAGHAEHEPAGGRGEPAGGRGEHEPAGGHAEHEPAGGRGEAGHAAPAGGRSAPSRGAPARSAPARSAPRSGGGRRH